MYDNMMNDGGMHGWMNGGMWVWPVIVILVAVLMVVVVIKLLKKLLSHPCLELASYTTDSFM